MIYTKVIGWKSSWHTNADLLKNVPIITGLPYNPGYPLFYLWWNSTILPKPATVYEEGCCAVCKTIAWAAKDTYRNRAQILGKNLLPKQVFVSTWNAFSPENGLNVDSPGIWTLFLLVSCSECSGFANSAAPLLVHSGIRAANKLKYLNFWKFI